MPSSSGDHDKREELNVLTALVSTRLQSDRNFRRAVGSLESDLTYLAATLKADPGAWRQNRAFHIVHVPSFIAIMAMLDEIDEMETIPDDERHQVLSSVNRSVQLVSKARQKVERTKLADAKIELEVLAEYSPSPDAPYQKPSLFTRTFDSIASTSESAWHGAKSRAAGVPDVVGGLQETVSGTLARASSAPALMGNLQKTVSGALADNITTPISMRLNAGGKALGSGLGTGVGLGVVAGILCPPLLPLTAGGAVLAAMRTWRKEMDQATALNEAERQHRIAELKAHRAAALRQLTHGADAIQMETDELSMMLDVETGAADAVILKGQHSGRSWSSLSSLEKADTGLMLLEGASSLLRIVELTLED